MSSKTKIIAIALTGALAAAPAFSKGPGGQTGPIVLSDLSEDEALTLVYMREEEKVARDVYIQLDETYGAMTPVFANISEAEQTHMDTIKTMVDRYETALAEYDLVDPVGDNPLGKFSDLELQALYDELVDEGANSYDAALNVGGLIEEVDIFDLREAIAETDNADLANAYNSLLNGSYNHLRAFVGQLEQLGLPYVNTVLDDADFDAIISGEMRTGGKNNGPGGNGGRR